MRSIITAAVMFSLSTFIVQAQEFTKAIEDNSYFIEEAYNQEDRVVQHILNGASFTPGNAMEMSFTQEWPAFGRAHQLSITLPFTAQSAPAAQGIGDVMLNYRYQMIDAPGLAFSPRLSVILPTGDEAKGFGTGSTGLQVNLPLSKRFSNEVVAHANAGMTVIPDGASAGTAKETYSDFFTGVSTIYLANQNFNVMLEALLINSGSAAGRGTEVILSPGVRWAVDIGDLQIVPGLAFPFTFASGKQSNGFFLYLSFEHPY